MGVLEAQMLLAVMAELLFLEQQVLVVVKAEIEQFLF
jgi:hypothetical protein